VRCFAQKKYLAVRSFCHLNSFTFDFLSKDISDLSMISNESSLKENTAILLYLSALVYDSSQKAI